MIDQELRPPIPARLAGCPQQGGLVVPWINVSLADGGADFRSTHHAKWARCYREGRCQVCGERLTSPLVLFGGPNQIAEDGYHDEPPLHPECARYAAQACPMIAGRMPTYSPRDTLSQGRRGAKCPDPGCACGGWVPHREDYPEREAHPAHAWYAVWCDDYALAVSPEGQLLGAKPINPRRIRTLSEQHHRRTLPRRPDRPRPTGAPPPGPDFAHGTRSRRVAAPPSAAHPTNQQEKPQ